MSRYIWASSTDKKPLAAKLKTICKCGVSDRDHKRCICEVKLHGDADMCEFCLRGGEFYGTIHK